jgi:uncharacterized membrane protein YedE/YeeE
VDNSIVSPDYWMAAAGGLLIGLSAVLLLFLNGRMAGISGIFWGWRFLFLVGLVVGGVMAHVLAGAPLPQPSALPVQFAVASGLLVGLGVQLGGGCTSGHGVCGMGMLSPRSIAATVTFMAFGIATVAIVRHALEIGA